MKVLFWNDLYSDAFVIEHLDRLTDMIGTWVDVEQQEDMLLIIMKHQKKYQVFLSSTWIFDLLLMMWTVWWFDWKKLLDPNGKNGSLVQKNKENLNQT